MIEPDNRPTEGSFDRPWPPEPFPVEALWPPESAARPRRPPPKHYPPPGWIDVLSDLPAQ